MGVATASAIIGIGTAAYQTGKSISDQKRAQKKLDNFKFTPLVNPAESIQLNTEKSEQQTRANNINLATSVDALQRAGSRAVIAGVPSLNESSVLLQNIISQDLANQERERDILIARGEERIQNIQAQRENQALQGIGQELNVARQNINTGFGDIVSSGLALNSAINFEDPFARTPRPEGLTLAQRSGTELNSVGLQNVSPEIVTDDILQNNGSIATNPFIFNYNPDFDDSILA